MNNKNKNWDEKKLCWKCGCWYSAYLVNHRTEICEYCEEKEERSD